MWKKAEEENVKQFLAGEVLEYLQSNAEVPLSKVPNLQMMMDVSMDGWMAVWLDGNSKIHIRDVIVKPQ